jgi:hypothetical protein
MLSKSCVAKSPSSLRALPRDMREGNLATALRASRRAGQGRPSPVRPHCELWLPGNAGDEHVPSCSQAAPGNDDWPLRGPVPHDTVHEAQDAGNLWTHRCDCQRGTSISSCDEHRFRAGRVLDVGGAPAVSVAISDLPIEPKLARSWKRADGRDWGQRGFRQSEIRVTGLTN